MRDDKTGPFPPATADPAADLDVLGRRLRLADDRHEAEPVDVDADLDDVRGEADIDAVGSPYFMLQLLDRLRDLVAAAPAGQLHRDAWPATP